MDKSKLKTLIAEIYDEIESTVMLHQSMPIKNYKEVKEKMIERFNKEILALLEKCPAMTIEDCPWGKENVEFREIFLRGINRQLEGIKMEEKCPMCLGESPTCAYCKSTGKIRRPAIVEDIDISTNIGFNIDVADLEINYIDPIQQLKNLKINATYNIITKSGGRLVIDSK